MTGRCVRWLLQINLQLETFYEKRRCYEQGNLELKEAVTNISHESADAIDCDLWLFEPAQKRRMSGAYKALSWMRLKIGHRHSNN